MLRWLASVCGGHSSKSESPQVITKLPDVPLLDVQDVCVSRVPSTTTAKSRTTLTSARCPFDNRDGPIHKQSNASHWTPITPHLLAQSLGVDLQRCMEMMSAALQHNTTIPTTLPTVDILSLQVRLLILTGGMPHAMHDTPPRPDPCAHVRPFKRCPRYELLPLHSITSPHLAPKQKKQGSHHRLCATTCGVSLSPRSSHSSTPLALKPCIPS